jgi:hypothetical protein
MMMRGRRSTRARPATTRSTLVSAPPAAPAPRLCRHSCALINHPQLWSMPLPPQSVRLGPPAPPQPPRQEAPHRPDWCGDAPPCAARRPAAMEAGVPDPNAFATARCTAVRGDTRRKWSRWHTDELESDRPADELESEPDRAVGVFESITYTCTPHCDRIGCVCVCVCAA